MIMPTMTFMIPPMGSLMVELGLAGCWELAETWEHMKKLSVIWKALTPYLETRQRLWGQRWDKNICYLSNSLIWCFHCSEKQIGWVFEPPHDKTNKMMCAQKRQISLGICPVWLESLLRAQWVAKGPSFLHADSGDSDQTAETDQADLSLRWVHMPFCWFLSWGGSFDVDEKDNYVPPSKGRGTYCFWCGSCWRRC